MQEDSWDSNRESARLRSCTHISLCAEIRSVEQNWSINPSSSSMDKKKHLNSRHNVVPSDVFKTLPPSSQEIRPWWNSSRVYSDLWSTRAAWPWLIQYKNESSSELNVKPPLQSKLLQHSVKPQTRCVKCPLQGCKIRHVLGCAARLDSYLCGDYCRHGAFWTPVPWPFGGHPRPLNPKPHLTNSKLNLKTHLKSHQTRKTKS